MHVLIIPSWYPKDANDFRGSFFREQALSLQKYQLQVGVISPEMKGFSSLKKGYQKPILDSAIDCGIPTLRYFYANLIPKVDSLIIRGWVKRGELLFDEYVKQYGKPDVIHAHSIFKAGFLAYAISKKHGIPFILTEHSSAFAKGWVSSGQVKGSQKVIESASVLLAVSGAFKSLLNSTYRTEKWQYLPNIVSGSFLESSQGIVEVEQNEITFITVCNLTEKKRVDVLIKAFYKLQAKQPNIKLKIGGDGPEMPKLVALAKELNIAHLVTFLGKLNREQVKTEMSASNVYVLPSEYETFGVVAVEALALGKPVVATRCGGPESIITSDVGVLVDVNSPEALCDGMEHILHNLDSYCSSDIHEYCYKEFSEQAVITRIINHYQDALAVHDKK